MISSILFILACPSTVSSLTPRFCNHIAGDITGRYRAVTLHPHETDQPPPEPFERE